MKKNPELEKICKELYQFPPDWDGIVDRFKSHADYDPGKPIHIQAYAKHFSEIHLDLSLEKITEKNPGIDIRFRPVEDGVDTKDFIFSYSRAGRLYANFKDENTDAFHEYDQLLTVNGLPVVFEIKLTGWTKPKKMKKRTADGKQLKVTGSAVRNYLRPEEYNKRLRPVCQFFECDDAGYVIVICREMHFNRETKVSENSLYQEFKRNNGIIVPFYTDRKSFREEVVQKVIGYKLNLKLF